MAASFDIKRRGIVELGASQSATPSRTSPRSCALRTGISLSFDPSTDNHAPSLKLKLDAPVFLLNPEAKASLTRAQHINSTFKSPRRSIRLAIAVHIHSQHITSITFSRVPLPDHLAPVYNRLAGDTVLALHLKLCAPPALVAPNIPGPLIPSTHTDLDILQAFQYIADAASTSAGAASTPAIAQTLTLYLPGTSLTDEQASCLSTNFSATSDEALSEQPLDLQLNELFGGLGARQVPPSEFFTFVSTDSPTGSPSSCGDARSPPGYEDLDTPTGHAPPTYRPQKQGAQAAKEEPAKGRKRPRMDSPLNSAIDDSKEATKTLEVALGAVDNNVQPLMHSLQQQIAAAHSAIARLESLHATSLEREAAYLEREAAFHEQIALADERIAELNEASTVEYSETAHQEAYISECMGELRQELVELLDERLDAFGLDMLERVEVEEMVETHVNAAVDDLKERLASGRVVVLFPE